MPKNQQNFKNSTKIHTKAGKSTHVLNTSSKLNPYTTSIHQIKAQNSETLPPNLNEALSSMLNN